jgi:hypothetical protein
VVILGVGNKSEAKIGIGNYIACVVKKRQCAAATSLPTKLGDFGK